MNKTSEIALIAAREHLKNVGEKCKIRTPRLVPITSFDGILPLIPIFAGQSALSSLAGTVPGVLLKEYKLLKRVEIN